MLELFTEAIAALKSETASYPGTVQIWMKLMGTSFLASLFFVYSKAGARWILLALVLNVLGLIVGKVLFPDASRTAIGSCVHLLFWPPILWAVWRYARTLSFPQDMHGYLDWVYIIWLFWASLLLSISLFFDFRTLIRMGLTA